jgi:PAS domain S-box-containing protein
LTVPARLIDDPLPSKGLIDVVAHAPFGVACIRPDMTILDANPKVADLFLVEARDMVGSSIGRYFSPDEAGWVRHQLGMLSTAPTGEVHSESYGQRADGERVWLAWSATAVRKGDGEIVYYIATFEDRTAKHHAEVMAARNLNVLERLSKLKTEFLTTVSHEVRTALVGIQGFSEVLRDAESLDIAQVQMFADEVYREARRLDTMLGKMLELDQAPGSRTLPTIRDVDLNATVHEVVASYNVGAHGSRVVTNLDPTLPAVKGDSAMLRQVFSSLLSNALKYSPSGSAVAVSSRVESSEVQISVKDNGSGMPQDFDLQLFGRPRSDATSPVSAVVGSGLGLPMARQIVELHGGSIWFETAASGGSEFHFTIPMTPKPPARGETH